MQRYIQRRDSNGLETVDQFDNRTEAKAMLAEYRLGDPSAEYYISTRPCKAWIEASAPAPINVGDTLVCAETGKEFIAATDGFTFNYARNSEGQVFSDEGVNIRERRELLDRSKPVYAYVSGDGRHVTGWKGNVLGTIDMYGESRAGWNGGTIARFRVQDVHGQWWQGRGAGKGICCTLRPMKTVPVRERATISAIKAPATINKCN